MLCSLEQGDDGVYSFFVVASSISTVFLGCRVNSLSLLFLVTSFLRLTTQGQPVAKHELNLAEGAQRLHPLTEPEVDRDGTRNSAAPFAMPLSFSGSSNLFPHLFRGPQKWPAVRLSS